MTAAAPIAGPQLQSQIAVHEIRSRVQRSDDRLGGTFHCWLWPTEERRLRTTPSVILSPGARIRGVANARNFIPAHGH